MSTVTAPADADQLVLTPSESIVVRSSTSDALVVEATYGAGGEPPPRHFHPGQDEHFLVLEGSLRVVVDGFERELSEGDEIDIPRGAVHQMWNPHAVPARVEWRTAPGGRTESWFRAVDALHRSGRVGKDGLPSPVAFAVLLREYDEVIRLAGPQPLLRPALGLLAIVGRARGYSA